MKSSLKKNFDEIKSNKKNSVSSQYNNFRDSK